MFSYRKKVFLWFMLLLIAGGIWFLVLIFYPVLLSQFVDRYRFLQDRLISPVWCLILYLFSQISLIALFFLILKISNRNIQACLHGIKDDRIDDYMYEYLLRRNRVFGFNLFFFAFLLFLIWNYLFLYSKIDWLIPGNMVLFYLIILLAADILLSSRILSYAQSKWLVEKFRDFFDRHPDLNGRHWKWRYFYYNPSDERIVVPRPRLLIPAFNHAHVGFALLWYGILITVAVLVISRI